MANGRHFRSVFFNAVIWDERYESRNRNRRLIVSFEMVVDLIAERRATTMVTKTISFDSISKFRSNRVEDEFRNGLHTNRAMKDESLEELELLDHYEFFFEFIHFHMSKSVLIFVT